MDVVELETVGEEPRDSLSNKSDLNTLYCRRYRERLDLSLTDSKKELIRKKKCGKNEAYSNIKTRIAAIPAT